MGDIEISEKPSVDLKSVFRGYVDNPKKPLEIISLENANDIIGKSLEESLIKTPELNQKDQQNIKEIIDKCLEKLDPSQILSGHVRGIVQSFIPALVKKSDCVMIFFDGDAFIKGFDHEEDEISVNDFIFQSLTRKCKPSNYSRLVYRANYLPAIDSRKIRQNRKDARLLGKEVSFNALREMIHDQKNSSLLIVSTMIEYYKTGDYSNLEALLYEWLTRYPDDDVRCFLDRSLYEKSFIDEDGHRVKTIDVLYRLQENLSIIGFEPPETPDQELNIALSKASANFNHPSFDSIKTYEPSLLQINNILISAINTNQIGIDPSYIATVSWLRERLGHILQNTPFEVIEILYQDNTLKEMLRLMELTANSSPYFPKDFESFTSKYQKETSFQEAYRQIGKRLNDRQVKTFRYFKENASDTYKFGGNLTTREIKGFEAIGNDNIEKQLYTLGDLTNHKPVTNKGREYYLELLYSTK
jgi:hypothetical protein